MSTSLSNYGGSDGYKFYKGTSSPIPNQVIVNSDNVTEGSTNLYFTTARARSSISAGGALTYNSTTGEVSYTPPTILTDINISHSDDSTLGSAKSIKTYVDSQVQSKDDLSELSGTLDDITTGTTNVHFTATDETKLDGIQVGAEVNVNADWDATTGDAQILNKPSTFSPSSHTHTLSDITDSGTAAPLNVASSGDAASSEVVKGDDSRLTDARTPSSHTHAISEVTNLQTSLDAKAASSHTHTASEITDFDTEVANNSAVTANTAKVTNATHTGDATGSGALTVVALQGRAVESSAPSDGQVLKWNDSASEWQAMADNNSGGGGGGGTPAGSTGQIQFNDGGSFGANSNLSWDDSNARLGIGSTSPTGLVSLQGDFGTTETAGLYIQNDGTATADDVTPIAFTTRSSGWGTKHAATIAAGTTSTANGGAYLTFKTATTGQYAPTERLRIDADGNVGVGVTDFSSSGANAKLAVNSGFINVDDDYGLVFGGGTGRPAIQGSKADGEIYITNANLGIGTSAPSRKLSISHDNTAALAGLEVHNSTNTGDASAWFRTPASEWALGLDKSDSSNFKISNSSELGSQDKFILTTGGNLCLGAVTPNEKLDVHGSIRLSGSTRYVSFNSDDAKIVANSGSGGFSFYNGGSSGTERFRVSSDGNVSLKGGRLIIGEADVSSGHIDSFENLTFNIDTDNDDTNRYFSFTYDASSGAGTEVLRIDEADGAITGGGLKLHGGILGHKDSDASSITLVGGSSSANSGANITLGGTSGSATREVIFKSNSTETVRIDSSGNVGIGTNGVADTKLEVESANPTIRVKANTDNWAALDIHAGDTQACYLFMRDSGGERARIVSTTNNDIKLLTGGGTVSGLTIDSSGNCAIGHSVPTQKLHVNSESTNTVALFESTDEGAGIKLTDNIGSSTVETNDADLRIGVDEDGAVASSTISLRVDGSTKMQIASTGRVTVKKSSNAEVTALTDGATITPDLDDANNFSVTLGGNRTLANPSNCTAGQSGIITITQDGTGSRTLAYGAYWKFSGGTAPTLTTTASAVDVLAYYVESATRITATLITDTK